MCYFVWGLAEHEVLNGSFKLVATRERYIHLNPMFRSTSFPLHTTVHDKLGIFLKCDERKGVGQLCLEVCHLRILQIPLVLVFIYSFIAGTQATLHV